MTEKNEKTEKTATITLNASFPFSDNDAKMLWALVNNMLQDGKEVTARIKSIGTDLAMSSLMKIGNDPKGNPVFGIGPKTQIALALGVEIDLVIPGNSDQLDNTP